LLRVLVRRKPGVSVRALKQDLVSVVQATSAEEPARMVTMRKDMEIRVVPLRQWLTGNIRTMVLVLEGAVAMVLLIACLNIASLQVARAIARKKEIAVRASVGASGARLVRQLLTENLLVCSVAALAGLMFGYASLGALRTFLPANLHLADMLRLDRTVLLYTLGITLAAGIITGLVPAATKAVHAADAAQPVYDVSSMEDRVSKSLATERANMTLMGVFAALALILATVGIFGVIAYFVNSRVQEIAIRMALGASGRTVVRMVLHHGMALAGAGIAAGIGGALILTRTLGSLVEGIGTNDAVSFVAASLVFGIIAAMACSIPARRAARVDPMVALRHG